MAAKSRLHPRSIAVVRDQAGSNDRKGGILAFRLQGDVQLLKEQSRGEGVSCRCKGPCEEWSDVSHRAHHLVVHFSHRSDVVHRALCRVDALGHGAREGQRRRRRADIALTRIRSLPSTLRALAIPHVLQETATSLSCPPAWSARSGGARSGPGRHRAPGGDAGRWLARETHEVVTSDGLKPSSASRSLYWPPIYWCPPPFDDHQATTLQPPPTRGPRAEVPASCPSPAAGIGRDAPLPGVPEVGI